MAEMRASMLLRIAVEGKDQVQGLAREMDALRQAGQDLGAQAAIGGRASDWAREQSAVEGVTTVVRQLGEAIAVGEGGISQAIGQWDAEKMAVGGVTGAVRQLDEAITASEGGVGSAVGQWDAEKAAVGGVTGVVRQLGEAITASEGDIGSAVGQWDAEKAAVGGVIAEINDLEAAIQRVARERLSDRPAPAAGGAGGAGAGGGGTEPPDEIDPATGGFNWGGWKLPPHRGARQGTTASEWAAQQQQLRDTEEQAERTSERLGELTDQIAHYGMGSLAFGSLRGFGQGVRAPIEAADNEYAAFQERFTDLAIQADRPHDAEAFGENLLTIAGAANVPWQEPLAGEQRIASLGGGDQLAAIRPLEVGLNKLAVASRAKTEDLYGSLAHYIQAGLTPQQAFDALKVNYAQGLGGAFELHDMTRFMPSLAPLGKSIGMTPWQAATDVPALLQIFRENTGTPGEAATLARYVMQKFGGDPRTLKRTQADLGLDLDQIRKTAQAAGQDPLVAMLNAVADKDEAGDPKVVGDIAREYHLRAAINAFRQHREELSRYNFTPEEGQKKIDEGYDVANSTVAAEQRRAEIAQSKAAIRAGQSQRPIMGAVAGAQAGAWDFGSYVAQHFPVMTGVFGTGTNVGGAALQAFGKIGEGALGLAAAAKSAQWIGTKYPGIGSAADMFLKGPYDLTKGFAQGITDGLRQGIAEAAKSPIEGRARFAPPQKGLQQLGPGRQGRRPKALPPLSARSPRNSPRSPCWCRGRSSTTSASRRGSWIASQRGMAHRKIPCWPCT